MVIRPASLAAYSRAVLTKGPWRLHNPMKLDLYIKTWCPWCHRAVDELNRLGHAFTLLDIESDPLAAKQMVSISGQTRVPTLIAGQHVLADFGPEELAPFFKQHGILGTAR
jgi:glutaredoxin